MPREELSRTFQTVEKHVVQRKDGGSAHPCPVSLQLSQRDVAVGGLLPATGSG